MRSLRSAVGGLGNIMFKQAFIISKCLDGEIPDVYLQGEKYWKKHADTIRKYFSEDIKLTDKVALHIRRGDYLKADHFHVDLSKTDYYQQAVLQFPNEKFLVFCKDNQGESRDTEDRLWCADFLNLFIPGRWEFASLYLKEHEDMNLMAGCKSVIGANSSFSWWAAFLGEHEKVVMPKNWFMDGIQRTELLEDWILL